MLLVPAPEDFDAAISCFIFLFLFLLVVCSTLHIVRQFYFVVKLVPLFGVKRDEMK